MTTPPASTPDPTGTPDGAKPGAVAVSPADRYAYNADGRAEARERAPITIGSRTFHRQRKNWAVTRELRSLLREQERAGARGQRLRARIDALTSKIRGVPDDEGGWKQEPITDESEVATLEDQVAELDTQVDLAQDESDEAAFKMLRLLLRDDEGNAPEIGTGDEGEVGTLKSELDVEEAGELASMLATGREPDPMPETPSSSDS